MRESMIEGEQGDRPQIGKHNRIRLIQQNKKLIIEIQKLDVIISSIIERSATTDFQHLEENNQLKQKYSREQTLQMKEIARLKQEIKAIKASLADHKYVEIKNQQNQIVYLRREYDKLASEKYTLTQKKGVKEEALEYHKPLNQQTAQTYEKYKKTKQQNGELKYKIHEIEREVNKLHKYKELSKTSAPRTYDNPDYEFMKINNQIANMKKQMNRVDQKWKPKVESLDRQYFSLKAILAEKELRVQAMEKEAKNWENKVYSFRDETAVARDHQRVSSVSISPQKRKQMQELLLLSSNRSKQQTGQIRKVKQVKQKQKRQKDKAQAVSAKQLPSIDEKKEEQPSKNEDLLKPVKQARMEGDKASEKGSEKVSEVVKKPTKMLESVGVGTSFYYEDD